ncbi:MAG: DUF202 domain-containing protein [bacterium]
MHYPLGCLTAKDRRCAPGPPPPDLKAQPGYGIQQVMSADNEAEYVRSGVTREQMILRDHLAVDRTDLANERTLLAYVRTSLAFLVTGASALHFIEDAWARMSGIAFLGLSLVTALLGTYRFVVIRRRYNPLRMP